MGKVEYVGDYKGIPVYADPDLPDADAWPYVISHPRPAITRVDFYVPDCDFMTVYLTNVWSGGEVRVRHYGAHHWHELGQEASGPRVDGSCGVRRSPAAPAGAGAATLRSRIVGAFRAAFRRLACYRGAPGGD